MNIIKVDFYTPSQVKKLANKQLKREDDGPLAATIVALLGSTYLDLTDLSYLLVEDIVSERNSINHIFTHPISNKVVVIPKGWIAELINEYLNWCKRHTVGQQNLKIYCGRNPESSFLLKRGSVSFKCSPKSKDSNVSIMQPQALARYVRGLNLPVGITPRILNRSYLINLAEQQFKYGHREAAILNLELVSRLHRETISKLTRRNPETIEQSVKNLFG